MPGLDKFLWGGPAALLAAAAAFAIAWLATRRSAIAWCAAVIAGFAAGSVALSAHSQGLTTAAARLVKPVEAHDKLPLIALAAAAPALVAAAARRAWLQWLLAAPLAALGPLWLLWGGRFLPTRELRESGFTKDAWSVPAAVAILGAVAGATLAVWCWWSRARSHEQPLVRSLLAAAALGAAGITVASTGSITYGQCLALLAIAVALSGTVAWLMSASTGPESAAGPILLPAAALLVLAVGYSELHLWQAAALAVVIAQSAGSWPASTQRPARAAVLRALLVLTPLAAIAGHAAYELAASQRVAPAADEADWYKS